MDNEVLETDLHKTFFIPPAKDKSIALELLKRRRDIMIESPVYEVIKDEGRDEGKYENAIETARKMISKKYSIQDVLDMTGLAEEDLQKKGLI